MYNQCKTCAFLKDAPDSDDKQRVVSALTSPAPNKQAIADFLTKRGTKVDEKSIRRHIKHQEDK